MFSGLHFWMFNQQAALDATRMDTEKSMTRCRVAFQIIFVTELSESGACTLLWDCNMSIWSGAVRGAATIPCFLFGKNRTRRQWEYFFIMEKSRQQ